MTEHDHKNVQSSDPGGLAAVIREVIARRAAGEHLDDHGVIAAHPELMPELGKQLSALHKVEQARDGADELHESGEQPNTVTVSGQSTPSHPDRVGPYRILERLGEGGMGTVYMAEQTKPIRRRVALKPQTVAPFTSALNRSPVSTSASSTTW